jgi:hypothetical protein
MGNQVRPISRVIVGLGCALALSLLFAGGCKAKEEAPTNTGNSQYVEGAASKMGADRAKAHSRLPHGGNPPQGQ